MVRTGAFGYLQYGFEMCFGTAATSICTVFGLEQKITNWSLTNNRITLAALNQIEPAIYAYGSTRGSLGIDFVLSNPYWLGALWDTRTTTACMPTAGSHSHAYTIMCKLRTPISVEIGVCGTTNVVRTLTGGLVNSVSLRSSIGEVVRGSADISYANETEDAVIDATPATDQDNFPYTFAYGNLTNSAPSVSSMPRSPTRSCTVATCALAISIRRQSAPCSIVCVRRRQPSCAWAHRSGVSKSNALPTCAMWARGTRSACRYPCGSCSPTMSRRCSDHSMRPTPATTGASFPTWTWKC